MSQENVDVVVGLFENANVRNFPAAMDAYADDAVLHLNGGLWVAGGGGEMAAVGKAAVGEFFGDWFATFDRDYRFEIHETRDRGDQVFIVATHHGRGRESRTPIDQRTAWIYTLRDRRIARCEAYQDPEAGIEAWESG